VRENHPDVDLDPFKYPDADGNPNRVAYVSRRAGATSESEGMEKLIATVIKQTMEKEAAPPGEPEDVLPTRKPGEQKGLILRKTVVEAGRLLTLTPAEAREFHISSGTAENLEEVAAMYGGNPRQIVRYDPDWTELVVQFLNSSVVSGLLITIGLIALYVAMKTPGMGFPEVLALVFFGLFFYSKYLLGLAGVIEVSLFVAGVILILLEILVIPGFGVPGVAGILCMLVSLFLGLQRGLLPDPDMPRMAADLIRNLTIVMSSVALSLVAFAILLTFLPHSAFFKPLILESVEGSGAGYVVGSADQRALVGKEGVAVSALRPVGTAEIGGEPYSVVADGEFLDPGEAIVVQEVRNNRIFVSRK
jgi:membrane-bound serine protease (ClpP class)